MTRPSRSMAQRLPRQIRSFMSNANVRFASADASGSILNTASAFCEPGLNWHIRSGSIPHQAARDKQIGPLNGSQ